MVCVCVCVQAVLEQTLHQCGVKGKSSLKSYWNGLESESRRLNEVAKEQLGKLQEPKVDKSLLNAKLFSMCTI